MDETTLDTAELRARVILNAREAAYIARMHHTAWWGKAKRSPMLRRARRKVGRKTFWLTSGVIEWLEKGCVA